MRLDNNEATKASPYLCVYIKGCSGFIHYIHPFEMLDTKDQQGVMHSIACEYCVCQHFQDQSFKVLHAFNAMSIYGNTVDYKMTYTHFCL